MKKSPSGAEVPKNNLRQRAKNIGRAALLDLRQSERPFRMIGSGLAAGLTLVGGVSRIPFAFMSTTTVKVFQHSHSIPETAAVAVGLFGSWAFAAAKSADIALGHYPRATRALNKEFATTIDILGNSLPGFTIADRTKRAGDVLMHLRRGGVVDGVGATPYIVAAHAQVWPQRSINRLVNSTVVDAGMTAGIAGGALGLTIQAVSQHHSNLAEHIQQIAGNSHAMFAGGVLIMGIEMAAQRLRQAPTE